MLFLFKHALTSSQNASSGAAQQQQQQPTGPSLVSGWFSPQQPAAATQHLKTSSEKTSSVTLYKSKHEKLQNPPARAPAASTIQASVVPPVDFPPLIQEGPSSLELYKKNHSKIETAKSKVSKRANQVQNEAQKTAPATLVPTKSVPAKPVAAKPVAAKPVVANPVAAKPVAAKPVAAPVSAQTASKMRPAPMAKSQPAARVKRERSVCGGPFAEAGDFDASLPVAFFDERRKTRHWRDDSVPKSRPLTQPSALATYEPQPSAWLRAFPRRLRPRHLLRSTNAKPRKEKRFVVSTVKTASVKTTSAVSAKRRQRHEKRQAAARAAAIRCPGPLAACGNMADGIPAGFFDESRRTTHWGQFLVLASRPQAPYRPQREAWLIAYPSRVRPAHLRAPVEPRASKSPLVVIVSDKTVPHYHRLPAPPVGRNSRESISRTQRRPTKTEKGLWSHALEVDVLKTLKAAEQRRRSHSMASLNRHGGHMRRGMGKGGVYQPRGRC